jgi:hypothetical protein
MNFIYNTSSLGDMTTEQLIQSEKTLQSACWEVSKELYNRKGLELGIENLEDRLEYVEVQYGNEVEIWEDPKTGDAYEVPIEIDRHFNVAKKLT